MRGIEEMARELVKAYPLLSKQDKERFKDEKPVIGKCHLVATMSMSAREITIAKTKIVPLSCGKMTASLRNAKLLLRRRLPPSF